MTNPTIIPCTDAESDLTGWAVIHPDGRKTYYYSIADYEAVRAAKVDAWLDEGTSEDEIDFLLRDQGFHTAAVDAVWPNTVFCTSPESEARCAAWLDLRPTSPREAYLCIV